LTALFEDSTVQVDGLDRSIGPNTVRQPTLILYEPELEEISMNRTINSSLAKVGLIALALSLGGAITVSGLLSPAFASSGGGGGGGSGGGSGGGGGGGGSGGGNGGSGGGGNSGGGSGAGLIVCNKGWTYSQKKQVCVHSSFLDDKELYQQGRALALAGHYDNALDALEAIKDKNDSMVLTMIGYATRKSGHFDEGLAYYAKALALNPTNVNTHEYIGEAYAEKGQLDLAKAELIKVSAVCVDCEQYRDLSAAIAGKPDQD
jgi:tetratricopeptide (TPR) repeat protein